MISDAQRPRKDSGTTQRADILRVALTTLLCVLLLAVISTILASASPSNEQKDLTDAPTATPLDLTAGDPTHNNAMQSLLTQFESDGYQINGTQPIAEDRWSVLRGRQSIFSPHESPITTEWRLALCVHERSSPHSYLALRSPDRGYSPAIAKAIETEWLQYATPLPSEAITTAQELLAKIPQFHEQDRDPAAPCRTDTNDASVATREWRQGGANARDTNLHYYLRMVRIAGRYEIATELHESRDRAGNARGCWLCIDFIRLPNQPPKLAP